MALDNIRREPKRELIESGVGTITVLVVLPLYLWLVHYIVMRSHPSDNQDWWSGHIAVFFFLPVALFLGYWVFYLIFLYIPHAIGEEVCALMRSYGFDPRPKYRPREDYYIDGHGYYYPKKESYSLPPEIEVKRVK